MTRAIQHPMSDERLDRLVTQLLAERAEDIAVTVLPMDAVVPRIGSGRRRSFSARRRQVLLAAAALLAVAVIGAMVVGSNLVRFTLPPNPEPPALVDPTSRPPEPLPTIVPGAAGLVFYNVYREIPAGEPGCEEADASHFDSCISNQIWVANPDGTDARELLPETDYSHLFTMSPDGRRMIFAAWGGANLAEVVGPEPELANVAVLSTEVHRPNCDGPCVSDGEFTFSPDGTRLAFVRLRTGAPEAGPGSVVALMDVETGAVTELASTAVSGHDGTNNRPAWSPDGTRLVFSRSSIGVPSAEDRLQDTALFVVDVDGSNLRHLVPLELTAKDAAWSPDGSLIAFSSAVEWLGIDQFGKRENWNVDSDVYTVRPDGSELRQLTDSGPDGVDRGAPVQVGASFSSWTVDGRIVFSLARWAGQGDSTNLPNEVWVMDADGGNQHQLNPSRLADFTAAGCLICPYPPEIQGLQYDAYWRPVP